MSAPGLDGTPADLRAQVARLAAFARRSLRFWRGALAVLVGGALACAAVLILRKPTYRSETVVLYSEGIRLTDDAERPDTARDVSVRLKETLMSRGTLDAVANEFGLYPEVRSKLGPMDVVEELRRHVEFRAPGGDTFNIAFTGSSAEEAARVTGRLAALVIEQDAALRNRKALAARDFLRAEQRTAEAELRAKEGELASFMAKNPRFAFDPVPFSTGAAIRASLGASPPSQPGGSIREGRGVASMSSTLRAPSSALPPPPVPDGAEARAEVGRATAAVAAARANLMDLTTRFTSAHPDVRAAEAELLRESLRLTKASGLARAAADRHEGAPASAPASASASASPLPRDAATPMVRAARNPAAAAPIIRPATTVPAPASAAADVVALETDWVKLTRGVTEARQQQDQIEAALFRANIAANSEAGRNGGQFEVVDPAFVPRTPTPPGKMTLLGLFAAVSALLAALTAIIRTALDDRIHDASDLLGISELLVEVPRASSSRSEHVNR